jgi:arabinan endo-1,5-alpha-L-arabinosidase
VNLPLSPHYNLIDPFVFQESPSSPSYFTFGSFWDDIFQIELFPYDNMIDFGDWAQRNGRIDNVIRNSTINATVVEGAVMWKEGGGYYMFFSVGWCCNTPETGLAAAGEVYHVAVCRALAPTGPFHDQDGRDCLSESGGTTILRSHEDVYAPGGQGVMVNPENGRTVLYYHYGKLMGRY